jgi:hypothetical protein
VQGTYCGGWRRCAYLDAKTRVLAVGALASTTCNNFIADLLFLSEVSHSLLVAGAPCVHPYLGKSALLGAPSPSPLRPGGLGGALVMPRKQEDLVRACASSPEISRGGHGHGVLPTFAFAVALQQRICICIWNPDLGLQKPLRPSTSASLSKTQGGRPRYTLHLCRRGTRKLAENPEPSQPPAPRWPFTVRAHRPHATIPLGAITPPNTAGPPPTAAPALAYFRRGFSSKNCTISSAYACGWES